MNGKWGNSNKKSQLKTIWCPRQENHHAHIALH